MEQKGEEEEDEEGKTKAKTVWKSQLASTFKLKGGRCLRLRGALKGGGGEDYNPE